MNREELSRILENSRCKCVDFSGALLQDKNMCNVDMRGLDLHGAKLTASDLSGANLSGVNFMCADLSYAKLIGADCSGANLSRANLLGAQLEGANFRGANLYEATVANTILDKSYNDAVYINSLVKEKNDALAEVERLMFLIHQAIEIASDNNLPDSYRPRYMILDLFRNGIQKR